MEETYIIICLKKKTKPKRISFFKKKEFSVKGGLVFSHKHLLAIILVLDISFFS